MRRLKIALLSLGVLPSFTNQAYATTEVVLQDTSADFSKIIVLIVTAILVGLILFLGYKMDKSESQEQRKEEVAKKRKNDIQKDIYTSHKNEDFNEILDETAAFDTVYPNFNEEISDFGQTRNFDKTAVVESVNLSDFEEEYIEEEIFDKIKELEELENENIEQDEEYNENYSSTMVFNTDTLQNSKEDDSFNVIKGYDFEEEDVEDVKEPEVKKYTRKKIAKVEEVAAEKPKRGRKPATKTEEKTKKSTSKKTSTSAEKNKKEKTTKKTTSKRIVDEDLVNTIEKPKRGRKPAVKKEEKVQVVEKKIVEEQPKEEVVVEKTPKSTKKSTPKKSTTKKTTETVVKKTRADSTRRAAAKEAEAIKKRAQEKKAQEKKAQEKKATKNATAKKGTTKKTTTTTVKKTRAASVRKEIEKMQKK